MSPYDNFNSDDLLEPSVDHSAITGGSPQSNVMECTLGEGDAALNRQNQRNNRLEKRDDNSEGSGEGLSPLTPGFERSLENPCISLVPGNLAFIVDTLSLSTFL